MVYFEDALAVLPLIGIQGRTSLLPDNEVLTLCLHAGLLLARAYAVADRKQLVLAVLSILGVCTIATEMVCSTRILHFRDRACVTDGHPS